MAFQSLHTTYGLARLAQAESTRAVINLTHMAIGDGNGNAVEPDAEQATLVRERYRAAINRLYPAPNDPARFFAELVIPAEVGGWTLREVGVFDDQGGLFVVGNLPPTYKPAGSGEGAYSDATIRIEFVVANADTINLSVDPNVVVVTQNWLQNNYGAAQIIPGGTTGQVLTKETNADGDYRWGDPDVANVVVDMIEERQTLAASQTIVTFSVVTTRGLAVYIDGERINQGANADEWQVDPENPDTGIVLGQVYPAGTKLLGTQNEPTGTVAFPLIRDQNLADVQDKAAAREALGVYSKDEVNQRVRNPGDVFHTAAATPPPFSLKANGAAVSRTAYANLFARIGTRFGAGDGFTTFNLPDLRGEFIRGWDDGRGVDGGRELGSYQSGATQSHTHTGSAAQAGKHGHTGKTSTAGRHSHSLTFERDRSPVDDGNAVLGDESYYGEQTHTTTEAGEHSHSLSIDQGGEHSHSITIGNTGGSETRPRNVALLACIAF